MEEEFYKKVLQEVERQDKKWGIRNQHPVNWFLILQEEIGEIATNINDGFHEIHKMDIENYETEIIQSCAVLLQMYKNIEQHKLESIETKLGLIKRAYGEKYYKTFSSLITENGWIGLGRYGFDEDDDMEVMWEDMMEEIEFEEDHDDDRHYCRPVSLSDLPKD